MSFLFEIRFQRAIHQIKGLKKYNCGHGILAPLTFNLQICVNWPLLNITQLLIR
jgi:hypothetical protein